MQILVIDDELLARQTIIKSLGELGYTGIFQAENGIEAFELIQQIKPDVILADIRMPGMDGIELLTKTKKSIGDLIFIFISGYDVFEYARKALSLGAFNYLLKPIDTAELKIVLDNAVQAITQKASQTDSNSQLNMKLNQGLDYMKKDFIRTLLTQKNPYDAYTNDKLVEFNIHLPYSRFCAVFITMDDQNTAMVQMSLKVIELVKFALENISTEFFRECNILAYPFHTENGLGYLLNFEQALSDSPQQKLYEICCRIKTYINQHYHYSITIGIGSIVNSLEHSNKSYESAYKSVSQRLIKGNNHVIYFTDSAPHLDAFRMVDLTLEKEFQSGFEQGNLMAVRELLNLLYTQFKGADSIDSSILMKINLQLIMLFSRILKEMGISFEKVLGDEYVLYNEVNTCRTIDSILQWFDQKLSLCFGAVISIIEDGQMKISDKAKNYIHNFNGDVTLEGAADFVHLNPSYFSKLFKQESGENFIDYIVNFKINKAKELLKTKTYKVNEVCKLAGFNDVKHFYKVFKKFTGYTPNEYRDIWFSK